MSAASYQPGEILADKFRIERVLGEGGMGLVLAAFHLDLQQRVAIKVLRAALSSDAEVVTRFMREARAAVQITSPHVARVMDVARLPDGSPYLVMEHLDGDDLAHVLKRVGRLSAEQACSFMLQAGEAVAEAHALGIVHRDLKPANLFLARKRDGSEIVKVLDFGISKVSKEQALTRTNGMMGSPLYMSPEQLRSARDVDVRSDIWALGVTLFELLAGSPPFLADDLPQLMVQIMTAPPRSLAELRPDLPRELVAVVERCLAKEQADRFASIDAFLAALRPFASGTAAPPVHSGRGGDTEIAGIGPSGTLVAGARTTAPSSRTVDATTVTTPSTSRRPIALYATIAVVSLSVVGLSITLMNRESGRPRGEAGESKRALAPLESEAPAPKPSVSAPAPVVASTASVTPSAMPSVTSAKPGKAPSAKTAPSGATLKPVPPALPTAPEEGFKKGEY